MRRPRTTTSRARRSFAAALLLAWFGAWAVGLVHLSVESHRYCGEHGRFEEGHADVGGLVDPHDHGAEARTGDPGEASHDACPVLAAPPVEDEPPVPSFGASYATPPAPTPRVDVPPARPIPLLALAPKASPPRAV